MKPFLQPSFKLFPSPESSLCLLQPLCRLDSKLQATTDLSSVFLDLPLLISYKWNYTIQILQYFVSACLHLASCFLHMLNNLCHYGNSPFYCWILFHCMYEPHVPYFVYPLISWWGSGLSSVLGVLGTMLPWLSTRLFVDLCFYLSWVDTQGWNF